MDSRVLGFLSNNRVCSLTTLLKDGSPHASALHYSHITDPFELYFSTENTSKKCEALLDGKAIGGSVVIGFSEQDWVTFQMDGEIRAVLDLNELEVVRTIHYLKHPDAAQYKDEPATIFLKFTPKWWRYTDYNTLPITILSSN